ncbi:MAG: hypothetical protein JWO30_45 [Fibrobacteres bacterium]|nr:hypothetical protein [Fibrobacterota bacterium]
MSKKKVTVTLDTSDPLSTDPGSTDLSLPPPINPFQPQLQPSQQNTGLDSMRLQMPMVNKPSDLAPTPTVKPAATPPVSGMDQAAGYLAPVAAGFSAGSQTQPTTNAGGAVMQTVGSGIAGATAGAALGSAVPGIGTAIGAGVGGLVGLVSGGIQSYMGLKEARANKRAQEKAIAQVNKQNAEQQAYDRSQAALKRSDTLEQARYNRKQTAIASQWKAMQATMDILNKNMNQDENIKSLFLAGGR